MKTAFLHGDLEEDLYMEQQQGFKVAGKKVLGLQIEQDLVWLEASF